MRGSKFLNFGNLYFDITHLELLFHFFTEIMQFLIGKLRDIVAIQSKRKIY